MNSYRIVPWEEQYHPDFFRLSLEWLEKYVSVEPADRLILQHPHEQILDDGGEIFFLLADNVPVGTVSMIHTKENTFELAKLAVTESYKGKGLARMLMERAIEFAESREAEEILLYTNHNLSPAIGLYQKYGFEIVPLVNNKYLESDIKMRLKLKGKVG